MNPVILFAFIYISAVSTQGRILKMVGVTEERDLLRFAEAQISISKEPSLVLGKLIRRQRYAEVPHMTFHGLAYDNLLNDALNTTTEEPTTVATENANTRVGPSAKSGKRRHGKLRKIKTSALKLH